ncbi:cupin domain-containing protein [Prauserella endophytica]|uniref:LuxR family transcriptional regulator n=1 Tax=Prauserella endophytica TaxID=1592324 RepID=A0ABY2SCR0_9PSEU|nr:cupin domain-containing protein [Prauserella endophytica]PXY29120.1 hypothetical protein BAY59_15970 [Prauserella coralliicola]TKG72810.1 hypothetical protein FCN18_06190 [Prauserella endophytica]
MTDHQEPVALPGLAAGLLREALEHPSRRAARTVASRSSQRATVIALAEGADLGKHDAPSAATLQVLSGRARLETADRTWELDTGDLLPIPPERHGLHAITDTVVLLTVALR